ncbi:hypothetical protein DPEC_G00019650, partial [Dallia pectoralis]
CATFVFVVVLVILFSFFLSFLTHHFHRKHYNPFLHPPNGLHFSTACDNDGVEATAFSL